MDPNFDRLDRGLINVNMAHRMQVPSIGNLHEQVGVEALKLGYHVLVEKPFSNTVESCQRFLAAVPDGIALMCAENSHYWREVVEAKRLIDAGHIGELLTVRAKFWESAHPKLNEWAAAGSYNADAYCCTAAEGFVVDGGLHWIRPLRMWLGECSHVVCSAGRSLTQMRGPSMSQALLKFTSGITAVFETMLAPSAISDQPFFVIQGSKGEIILDGFAGGGRIYTIGETGMHITDINDGYDGLVGWDSGYVGELQDFAAACLDGTTPKATGQEAMADLQLMLAMMNSAKTQRWEAVAEQDPQLSMESMSLAP
jgi:UDP-N-acetyl-2-amino-2-deoxyglucuronate dehydrogenase